MGRVRTSAGWVQRRDRGTRPSVLRLLTRRSRSAIELAAAAAACLCAAPAHAADGAGAILKDCQDDGHIDGTYPQVAYAKALASMPTDLDEYSDCRDQIRAAQLRAAAHARHAARGRRDGRRRAASHRPGVRPAAGSPAARVGGPAMRRPGGAPGTRDGATSVRRRQR